MRASGLVRSSHLWLKKDNLKNFIYPTANSAVGFQLNDCLLKIFPSLVSRNVTNIDVKAVLWTYLAVN